MSLPHVKDFVLDKTSTATIQAPDVVLKLLPLRPVCRDLIIGWISAIDEPEVHS